MSFFQRYGIEKAKSLLNSLGEAIVKFDPKGATEAAIAEIEAKFDKLNGAYSVSKQDYEREQNEYLSISELYKQRLAAAEYLQKDSSKSEALNQLVSVIEAMLPDIEREKQEADDAKQDMEQLAVLVDQFAEKLKSARHTVEQAQKTMQRAERQKESAQEKAEAATMAAGLSKSSSNLSTALEHMSNLAQEAKAEADAANRKAHLLKPTELEDHEDIKAAMDAVSGKEQPPTSIQDRIDALKAAV